MTAPIQSPQKSTRVFLFLSMGFGSGGKEKGRFCTQWWYDGSLMFSFTSITRNVTKGGGPRRQPQVATWESRSCKIAAGLATASSLLNAPVLPRAQNCPVMPLARDLHYCFLNDVKMRIAENSGTSLLNASKSERPKYFWKKYIF